MLWDALPISGERTREEPRNGEHIWNMIDGRVGGYCMYDDQQPGTFPFASKIKHHHETNNRSLRR